MADDHPVIRTFMTSTAVVAATTAYFMSPLMRFANPTNLSVFGFGLGVGAAISWSSMRNSWGRLWEWGSILFVGVSAVGLTFTMTEAQRQSDANDIRCSQIQNDMFLSYPARSDDAAIFSALGCRPQGSNAVQFLKAQPSKVTPAAAATASPIKAR